MYTKVKKLVETIVNFIGKMNKKAIPVIVIMAIVINLVNELLTRRSLGDTLGFFWEQPGMLFLNVLMVFATLSIPLITRRRMTGILLIGLVWLILGICNYVVLSYRVTPFSAVDIKLFKSVASIVKQYLSTGEIVAIVIVLVLILAAAGYMWFKIPKVEGEFRRWPYLLLILGSFGATYGLNQLGIAVNYIPTDLGNISFVYDACGYNYCFVSSLFDVGINRPRGYGEEELRQIQQELTKGKSGNYNNPPNIIIVQLESVYDLNNMRYYRFSENPLPNMTALSKEYTHGYITVPSIGAGTANTEFETISGMSLDYFGFCEYPYKTILKKRTSESICYALAERGYTSTAIHNNRGNFYSRNKVFKKLGFDRFDSVEYMNDLEYNYLEWARDDVLTGEILKALETTKGPDFVYTITVASHGAYPGEEVEGMRISMTGEPDEERANKFTYFANEVYETDRFVGELVEALSKQEERCIVLFFGDHLPTLDITDEELRNQNTFQTSYVMWDNFGLEQERHDMSAFQITSYIMERMGYENGWLNRFHQKYKNSPDYEKKLELLQYDMLYGKEYIYNGTNPYESSDMEMGLLPLDIHTVFHQQGNLYIRGENFTDSSYVYIDGDKKETILDDKGYLVVRGITLEEGDRVRVYQLAAGKTKLSKSPQYIYQYDYMPREVDTIIPID